MDGASSYTIQMSTRYSMSKPFVSTTVIPSEYIRSKDMPQNTLVYWRVRANGTNGPSPWSDVWALWISLP